MNSFTGTLRLARLAARRDRVQLPVWVLALTGVVAASASTVGQRSTKRPNRGVTVATVVCCSITSDSHTL